MRIKLIPNPKKRWAVQLAHRVRSLLSRHGHELVERKADATICIGGDGTILYANQMGLLEGRILGIGGQNSYICQLGRNSWKKGLLPLLAGSGAEKLMLLGANAGKKYRAINDFVVHTPDYRVITIMLTINGREYSFEGDGIIVSTALGSAGYAYSAGGKKLRPTAGRVVIVPICPYKRAFRPMLVSPGQKLGIRCDRESAFIVDGMFLRHLKKNERVTISGDGMLAFFAGVGSNGF